MSNRVLSAHYVIGSLSPGERADAARQRLSDPELDAQIELQEAMFSPLAGAAGWRAPPAGLKDRVMAAVAASNEFAAWGKQLQPYRGGNWRNILPGVDMKRLWAKGPKLMRCAPKSVVPAHDHDGHEHLVVLSGDFVLEGRRFALGDHLFSPAGSRHARGYTETGCILLIQND